MRKIIATTERMYQIKEELDKYVIGQENAKKQLISLIVSHIEKNKMINNGEMDSYKKSAALCIGSSGCGKTFLVETLCKILQLDFVSVNAAEITAFGWKGNDVSDALGQLYLKCDKDIRRVENSVIFIDEIDKKANFYKTQYDYESKDQAAILKFIEGEECTFKFNDKQLTVDTSNILFIFAGAFSTMKKNDKKHQKIGFLETDEEDKKITTNDLIQYGFMTEFVSRIGQIIQFDSLTQEDMKDILFKSKSSPLLEWEDYLKNKDVKLNVSNQVIDHLIDKAFNDDLGVRSLHTRFAEVLNKELFDLLKDEFNGEVNLKLNENNEIEVHKVLDSKFKCNKSQKNKLSKKLKLTGNYQKDKVYINYFSREIANYSFKYANYSCYEEATMTENLIKSYLIYLDVTCPPSDRIYHSLYKLLDATKVEEHCTYDLMIEQWGEKSNDKNYKDAKRTYEYFKSKSKKYGFEPVNIKKAILDYIKEESNVILKGGKDNDCAKC